MDNQNQQVQTPQSPNQMTSVDINNKSSGSKIIPIGLGILFVLVAIGSYLLGTGNNQTVVSNQQNSAVPTTIPTPTPDETANWKIYVGEEYEFKYPSNGYVVTDKASLVYISYEDGTKPYFTFTINIADNPNHLTTKQVVDKIVNDLRNNKDFPGARSQADQILQTMKEYTNGQITGIKLQSFDEGYPQGFGEVVEATENKIFTFYIGNGSGGGVSDNDERLLDQILSTFKFTDQNQAIDETANWKTHTDSSEFTFRYPSDWKVIFDPNKSGLILRSPDYSLNTEGIHYLQGGAEIYITTSGITSANIDDEFAKDTLGQEIAQNKRYITVNDQKALQYDFSYESKTATDTKFIKYNRIAYLIQYQYPKLSEKQKYWDVYVKFLDSFKGI